MKIQKLKPVKHIESSRINYPKKGKHSIFSGDIFIEEDIKKGRFRTIPLNNPTITFRPDGTIEVKEEQ